MAYYDNLIRDPDGAFAAIARSRNLSPEQLEQRIGRLLDDAACGEHLTLGDAQSYFDESVHPDEDIVKHVESCGYCKSLVEALSPHAVDASFKKVLLALEDARPRTASTAMSQQAPQKKYSGWSIGVAVAATVLVTLSISPLLPWVSADRKSLVVAQQKIDSLTQSLNSVARTNAPAAAESAELAAESLRAMRGFTKSTWVVEHKSENDDGETQLTLRQKATGRDDTRAAMPGVVEGDRVVVLDSAGTPQSRSQ